MQATDLGHGRGWLDTGAAASLRRVDAALGHALQVTEAGRTWARQWQHWVTYQRVGKPIALHPDTPSIHQLGNAIDSDEAQKHVALMQEHGWRRTVYRNGKLIEPWHFEYFPNEDKHRTSSGAGEDNDMTPEQDARLERVEFMLDQIIDFVGANGGMNTPTAQTLGHRVQSIQDYLGANGGAQTKTADSLGYKINALFRGQK